MSKERSEREALRASLNEILELCAVGDVTETTEALGWGEVIQRARAALSESERTADAPSLALHAGAAQMSREVRMAVMLAYGHLWHVNNESAAPIPLYPPEKAAYAARKYLRDLLTTQERGEGINQAGVLIGRYDVDGHKAESERTADAPDPKPPHYACPSHCCPIHGCKYGHDDCPVFSWAVAPKYPNNNGCERCERERTADAPGPVAHCALTPNGQIAYFDGKPMVMVGPVSNYLHPHPLYTAPPSSEAVAVIERASRILRGEGAEDQGDAYDKALRLLDAFLEKQK